jgi:hypothetical protein
MAAGQDDAVLADPRWLPWGGSAEEKRVGGTSSTPYILYFRALGPGPKVWGSLNPADPVKAFKGPGTACPLLLAVAWFCVGLRRAAIAIWADFWLGIGWMIQTSGGTHRVY